MAQLTPTPALDPDVALDELGLPHVALVAWPAEGERRERCREAGVACLLLVADGALPPAATGCLEDWASATAPPREVEARLGALRRRALAHRHDHASPPARPTLDEADLLHFEGGWVALPPVERRLADLLVDRFAAVVGHDELAAAAWPDGAPDGALRPSVHRLRRRIAPLGLVLRTVRSRGYLLDVAGRG